MTCREFADFMGDYLADDLAADVRARFVAHLNECADCLEYLGQYEDTIALGRHAFADDDAMLPAEVPDALVEAILASCSRQP